MGCNSSKESAPDPKSEEVTFTGVVSEKGRIQPPKDAENKPIE